jgi:hypothetical protein
MSLLDNRKALLDAAEAQSLKDPFRFGEIYNSGADLVPHAFGYWMESSFFNELTNTRMVKILFRY